MVRVFNGSIFAILWQYRESGPNHARFMINQPVVNPRSSKIVSRNLGFTVFQAKARPVVQYVQAVSKRVQGYYGELRSTAACVNHKQNVWGHGDSSLAVILSVKVVPSPGMPLIFRLPPRAWARSCTPINPNDSG